jgi:protein TonB
MTAAFAPAFIEPEKLQGADSPVRHGGAHTLLRNHHPRPAYLAQGGAVLVYILALGALSFLAKPQPAPQEEPLELVMVPADEQPAPDQPPTAAPTPPPEAPPPVAEAAPTPPDDTPPPPVATEPEPVAPVAPPPEPPPVRKAEVKPKPKAKPAPAPVAQQRPVGRPSPGAPGPSQIPPNAIPSNYANLVHARIAYAAANTYPRSAIASHLSARIAYHVIISPSGAVISKSITPSGNPVFDSAATEALARAAPFPSTGIGRPVSLSGAIAYRLN